MSSSRAPHVNSLRTGSELLASRGYPLPFDYVDILYAVVHKSGDRSTEWSFLVHTKDPQLITMWEGNPFQKIIRKPSTTTGHRGWLEQEPSYEYENMNNIDSLVQDNNVYLLAFGARHPGAWRDFLDCTTTSYDGNRYHNSFEWFIKAVGFLYHYGNFQYIKRPRLWSMDMLRLAQRQIEDGTYR